MLSLSSKSEFRSMSATWLLPYCHTIKVTSRSPRTDLRTSKIFFLAENQMRQATTTCHSKRPNLSLVGIARKSHICGSAFQASRKSQLVMSDTFWLRTSPPHNVDGRIHAITAIIVLDCPPYLKAYLF